MMKKIALALAVVSLALPSSAFATHASGSSSRAQKFFFAYGANLPSAYQGPVNRGFAAWDAVSSQCHDWRLGPPYETIVYYQNIDGQFNAAGLTNADHGTIILDSSEDWWTPTTQTPYNRIDVQGVAAHESGHALSLIHDTSTTQTMYSVIQYGTDSYFKRVLGTNDSARERTLYPYGTCTA